MFFMSINTSLNNSPAPDRGDTVKTVKNNSGTGKK
jgi:hypothetical protein